MFGISGISGWGWPGRTIAGTAGVLGVTGLAFALVSTSLAAGAAAAPHRGTAAASVAGALYGVSCTSSSCVAVGGRSAGAGTLTEKWNGTKWSVVTSPNPAGSSGGTLWGVACTSAKSCLAVGQYDNSSHTATLPTAEQWNGSKWSVLTVPAPSGATAASLRAVSCVSATSCQAVGSSNATGTSTAGTLAEGWNGSKWSIEPSPSPNPSKTNALTGVSCPSASLCWAVGYTFPTNYTGTLTEKWNGSKWSVVTTPTSKANQAIADACFGTSACMTVGISNKLFAFAQDWNGTKWALTPAPVKPSGTTDSEFNAVTCTAAATCEAVGNYTISSGTPALAEGWNGSKWAAQATPAISGASYVSLQGIACPAASNCWAVGESIAGSATSPVIEHWNGTTWSLAS